MRPMVGDVRLHVSVTGEEWLGNVRRPAIVAVHGGPGVDGSKLRVLMGRAAGYAQVLVPDQRGHGHSDPSQASHWNLDTWADDLATLIDVLDLEKPFVLGTSFGGFVVQHYLARHPDQPAGAILIATQPRVVDHEALVERFRRAGGDGAAAAMAASVRDPSPETEAEWMRVCAPLLARYEPNDEVAEVRRRQIYRPEINLHFAPELNSMDLRPGLAKTRCPVLVLLGEEDPLVPPEAGAEILHALPDGLGRLHLLPDAAHDILNDQPVAAHVLIREFVLSVPPAGRSC